MQVILFGVGSPLVADVEESLHRIGYSIAVGVRNRESPTYLSPGIDVVMPDAIPALCRHLPFLAPFFTPGNRLLAVAEAEAAALRAGAALIDPTSILPRDIIFGDGSYINAGCVFGARSRFGRHSLVNRSASIGHDATFGDFVSVGPGVVVAGNVTVGDGAMLGAGCVVLPSLAIGAGAVVSAGAVVTRDVPAKARVRGNPARLVEDRVIELVS